jgi:hypothetical protein
MTRWMRPADVDRSDGPDRFDPVIECARCGLTRELAVALWERLCADSVSRNGRHDEEDVRQTFRALAAQITKHGGLPEPGKATRVGLETDRPSPATWNISARRPGTPGKETLATVDAQLQRERPSAPGRKTLMGDDVEADRPTFNFDDHRVVELKALLRRLSTSPKLRQEVVVAATSADRTIAGRATLWGEQLLAVPTPQPGGLALCVREHVR